MGRWLSLALMLWTVQTSTVLAQFIPPEQPSSIKGFGRTTNPKKDCKFLAKGEELQLTLPATVHDLSVEIGRMNAPRVLQPVSGNFTLAVKVSDVTHPQAPSAIRERKPFIGAGLLIMADEKNYIRLERASLQLGNSAPIYANWELRQNGRWIRQGNAGERPLTSDATWLRIQRQGNEFLGSVSDDGESWTALPPITLPCPEEVQAGIAAVNDTPAPFKPRFSEFSLSSAGADR